ncbi:MAG TPA: putative hydro-lyase [Arenibaculum sp.]|nr:putative hydro-lyase [Arenibaculum sp.]
MGTQARTTGGAASAPGILRGDIRSGRFSGPTSGQAPGYLQGNLAILPDRMAADFLRYCVRNPKPCPLLAVGEPGEPVLAGLGCGLDVRTDLPGYRVFRDGEHVASPADLLSDWRDDLVTFVLGCSFSFEAALLRAGIRVPHIEAGRNVPMYVTNLETHPAGPFGGPTVVSMRAFTPADAISAIVLSNRYPLAHGAPLHIGDPAAIGIADSARPDFGDPPILREGDVPVFWACGVTPQMAIRRARPDLAITHEPGCMLVTDLLADDVR